MKRVWHRFAAAAATTFSLLACENSIAPSPIEIRGGDDAISMRIREIGFDPTGYVLDNGHVIVEGDIALPFSRLGMVGTDEIDLSLVPLMHQYRDLWSVSASTANSITVNISALDANSSWRDAAEDAIAAWNAIPGSYARFAVTSGSATVTVSFAYAGGRLAEAQAPPSNGTPGSFVRIDTIQASALTQSQKLYTVAHELGHILGIRHTNPFTSGGECHGISASACTGLGTLHVPYTPTSSGDANSVFNVSVQSWNSFSYYDRVMIVSLFPLPTLSGASVSYNQAGNPVFSWTANSYATEYRLRRGHETQWYSPEYGSMVNHGLSAVIASTTSTTLTDFQRTYTGGASCYWSFPDVPEEAWRNYYYVIEAVFPTGSTYTMVGGDVFTCDDINDI